MPITASVISTGAQSRDAFGNSARLKRKRPYVPIFSNTPASITAAAVGASVCASGSQVCNGKRGTLIQKASANARHNQYAGRGVSGFDDIACRSVGKSNE